MYPCNAVSGELATSLGDREEERSLGTRLPRHKTMSPFAVSVGSFPCRLQANWLFVAV